jgi:hypothetical protein
MPPASSQFHTLSVMRFIMLWLCVTLLLTAQAPKCRADGVEPDIDVSFAPNRNDTSPSDAQTALGPISDEFLEEGMGTDQDNSTSAAHFGGYVLATTFLAPFMFL